MKVGFSRTVAAAYVVALPACYLSVAANRLWPSVALEVVLTGCALSLFGLSLHFRRINGLNWDRPGWLHMSWPLPPGWTAAFGHLLSGKELARALRTLRGSGGAARFG
jgi:hypothetical protein